MKDLFILKLLDRISFIFERFGVNYKVMRGILQIKLLMDQRRVPTVMNNNSKNEGKNAFRTSLFMYSFIGLFIAIMMFAPLPLYFKMNITFGMIIFMVMTTMISDFSSVLLDVRDKTILLPRPIDARTINAAKLIHILIYLSSITLSLAGLSAVFGTIRYGPGFLLLFLLELALICGFVMFFTSILYFVILWFFDGEKLKDIINYFQIVLTVFMTIMYQFIGRIFDLARTEVGFTPEWWNFLIPSTWFAAPFNLLLEGSYTGYFISLSILGLVIPVITFLLYLKVIIPYFEKSLQKLNNHGEKRNEAKAGARAKRRRAMANMVCFNNTEKTFFTFADCILANARKLKLSLYPSLALSVIMPFVMFISFHVRGGSLSDFYTKITSGKYYLFAYMSVAFLASCLMITSKSENYKGAWIYKALPVYKPAEVIKGVAKAFIYKYIIPTYLIVCAVFIAIYGFGIVPDMVLIFLNLIILMLFIFKFSKKELPFSKDFQYAQDGSNVAVVLLSFVICAVFAAIHYFVKLTSMGLLLNIAASMLIAAALWHFSFKISWKDIRA